MAPSKQHPSLLPATTAVDTHNNPTHLGVVGGHGLLVAGLDDGRLPPRLVHEEVGAPQALRRSLRLLPRSQTPHHRLDQGAHAGGRVRRANHLQAPVFTQRLHTAVDQFRLCLEVFSVVDNCYSPMGMSNRSEWRTAALPRCRCGDVNETLIAH